MQLIYQLKKLLLINIFLIASQSVFSQITIDLKLELKNSQIDTATVRINNDGLLFKLKAGHFGHFTTLFLLFDHDYKLLNFENQLLGDVIDPWVKDFYKIEGLSITLNKDPRIGKPSKGRIEYDLTIQRWGRLGKIQYFEKHKEFEYVIE